MATERKKRFPYVEDWRCTFKQSSDRTVNGDLVLSYLFTNRHRLVSASPNTFSSTQSHPPPNVNLLVRLTIRLRLLKHPVCPLQSSRLVRTRVAEPTTDAHAKKTLNPELFAPLLHVIKLVAPQSLPTEITRAASPSEIRTTPR